MADFIAGLIGVLTVGIVAGLMLSVIATPVFCILRKIFIAPLRRNAMLNKAIKKGHIVQARLVKRKSVYNDVRPGAGAVSTNEETGVYEYIWNNKTYKYRAWTYMAARLPEEETLYFLRNPAKADTESKLGIREGEHHWIVYYFVIALIICAVFCLIGAYMVNAKA